MPDLAAMQGRAFINGTLAGEGTGADVLGHPLHALAWLANHLAARGDGLEAGQLVLTGSLVKTVWLKAGDRVAWNSMDWGRWKPGSIERTQVAPRPTRRIGCALAAHAGTSRLTLIARLRTSARS